VSVHEQKPLPRLAADAPGALQVPRHNGNRDEEGVDVHPPAPPEHPDI
jgi:hypothetical protein